ncbi:MAG: gluconolaconase [Pyrinomonadaceae bacterium]
MNDSLTILSIDPRFAIPGGEIAVDCRGFVADGRPDSGCFVGGRRCRTVAASPERILAIVPDEVEAAHTHAYLRSGDRRSELAEMIVGERLLADMHIVANPAVDPSDGSIVTTRSGSRGYQLEHTLYRLEPDGFLDEMPAQVLNPTGIAFGPDGELYVTNRAEGEVCRVVGGEEVVPYVQNLGIATGIAFDADGVMYVGDRAGTIYRIPRPSRIETYAVLEPSVAAYHLAFGPDGRLFVTAPGLASSDAVYAIDDGGHAERYFTGLGRPQGIAFDSDGDLYVAAAYRGRRGIVRISAGGVGAELFVAGMNVVGLCFDRSGDLIVATTDSLYSIPAGVQGSLLK